MPDNAIDQLEQETQKTLQKLCEDCQKAKIDFQLFRHIFCEETRKMCENIREKLLI